ncbi:MBL fold metallo-hydrolase [Pseudoroseomonas wenyumeiae]
MVEGEGWRLTALHTPGHCANHLCFALEGARILFSGDHAMSCSTSVVMPPDGDMASYMAALARVAAAEWALLLPGHGAPLPEPGPLLHALLAHRWERRRWCWPPCACSPVPRRRRWCRRSMASWTPG